MAITQSPLLTAANNIVKISNRSGNALPKAQSQFQDFSRFLDTKRIELERTQLPSKKKIQSLANIDIVNNFGSAGSLLKNLLGGALDLGSFVSGMFPGRGEKVGKPSNSSKPQPKPSVRGGKLRLGGLRALGIANAVFAGLDFATGLAEGEGVGKAGAGALGSFGGAVAGSLLAGAIGQALIPVPGVGFVLGMVGGSLGGFLGGFGADRAYEAVTGGDVKQKQEQKLKEQEVKQRASATRTGTETLTFNEVLMKFNESVIKFEDFSVNIGNIMGVREDVYGYSEELPEDEIPEVPDTIDTGPINYGTGNAEFGETGNVSNAKGWVHGHFQGDSPQAVTKDTTMVVKALLKQGSPVYLNQPGGKGVDLSPKRKYSDEEIYNYVENARKSHTHSGTGKSIDVFVKKGTKVPVPLVNIGPTGSGYGGYGRGGNSGYIQGTKTWIGHLTPESKPGLEKTSGLIRGKESPEVNLKTEDKLLKENKDVDPTTSLSKNNIQNQPQKVYPEVSPVLQNITSPKTVSANKIQTYPSYSQGQSYIMERETIINSGGSSGGKSRPNIVPMGAGGNSGNTIIISPESGSMVLNSLMKSILLTSLSST